MYLLLILQLAIVLFVCYIIFHREILSPPIIVVIMYFLCSVVGLIRFKDWNVGEYSGYTVICIMLGVISFVVASYMVFATHPFIRRSSVLPVELDRIEINNIILLIMFVACVINDVMMYGFIRFVARSVGIGGAPLSQIINRYYNLKSFQAGRFNISGVMTLLNIFCNSFSTFCIFVLINNIVFRKFKPKDLWLIMIIAMDAIYSLLNSSRGDFLVLLAETAYLLYFFWNIKSGWRISINKKIASWSIRTIIVFVIVFLSLTVLLGRRESIKDVNIIDYLTIYSSSSIRNFDLFLSNNPQPNVIFGKETFFPINRLLYNLFGIGEIYSIGLEFNSINGQNIGNLYTALRRYYADFGIMGVVIIPAFLGWFFSKMYVKTKQSLIKGNMPYRLLLFAYLSTSLFYFPIEDRFFIYDLSLGRIAQYIILYVLFRQYVSKRKIVSLKRR